MVGRTEAAETGRWGERDVGISVRLIATGCYWTCLASIWSDIFVVVIAVYSLTQTRRVERDVQAHVCTVDMNYLRSHYPRHHQGFPARTLYENGQDCGFAASRARGSHSPGADGERSGAKPDAAL